MMMFTSPGVKFKYRGNFMATSQSSFNSKPKKHSNFRMNAFYNSTFTVVWDVGVVLIMLAIGGALDPHFLGLNLSFMHCLVLAASGLLAFYSGVTARRNAFIINLLLGSFFFLNAVLGILVGDRGNLRIGYGTSEDIFVKFFPGFLELSTADHTLHFIIATLFLIDAYTLRGKSMDFPSNLKP